MNPDLTSEQAHAIAAWLSEQTPFHWRAAYWSGGVGYGFESSLGKLVEDGVKYKVRLALMPEGPWRRGRARVPGKVHAHLFVMVGNKRLWGGVKSTRYVSHKGKGALMRGMVEALPLAVAGAGVVDSMHEFLASKYATGGARRVAEQVIAKAR